MLYKAYKLIDWSYEKHISVCHGRRALDTYSMALLSPQTQNYHFSNIAKIGLLSEVKNVLFVISMAYYAIQSI